MSAQWGDITAKEIAEATGGHLFRGSGETAFTCLGTDSRQVVPGQIFWALKGERHDGHDFAAEAIRGGSAGVVIQTERSQEIPSGAQAAIIAVTDTLEALGQLAMWWRHRYPIPVAVITGSVGKTTTKEMASTILDLGRKTLKNEGNFNNLVGLPLTLFQLGEEHRTAVLEMGMNRRGEIARLTEIADPDVGLITNVARAHLEGLGDLMGVARAKVELLEKMSSEGLAILNGDDEVLMKAASPFKRRIMTYGTSSTNDLRGGAIRNLGREGISFDLCHQGKTIPIRLRIPGYQNVFNALGAAAIALALQESQEHVAEGLFKFQGVKGRFTLSVLPNGAALVDDTYNSNPLSLKAALQSLQSLSSERGRVIVGLGEMRELGEETERAHREAGEMVAELGADFFVVMGKHGKDMIEGALRKGLSHGRTALAASHEEMASIIRERWREGDLVFLKGSRRVGLERVAHLLSNSGVKEA
ncbi:MAG: UDP-N-acetylmuramoyl-tripeptide--D-alanyl-D-alanine ligase [Deltaproteobacteria bacterium]|nr:UDP-N-acetylmuramoyl-tripeptide--D-alanyl-D-alanine ligase [Deltaproteobacteria bacterium]